jgi:hypothetical protein
LILGTQIPARASVSMITFLSKRCDTWEEMESGSEIYPRILDAKNSGQERVALSFPRRRE